jgi:acylphosphatase
MAGKIIVKLLPDGSIKVEAEGYTGSTCEEATRFLEQLGAVSGENKKPEYYETPMQVEGVKFDV